MVNRQGTRTWLSFVFEKYRIFLFLRLFPFRDFVRLFCETAVISYVFLWNFARETSAQAAKLELLAHALCLTAVLSKPGIISRINFSRPPKISPKIPIKGKLMTFRKPVISPSPKPSPLITLVGSAFEKRTRQVSNLWLLVKINWDKQSLGKRLTELVSIACRKHQTNAEKSKHLQVMKTVTNWVTMIGWEDSRSPKTNQDHRAG